MFCSNHVLIDKEPDKGIVLGSGTYKQRDLIYLSIFKAGTLANLVKSQGSKATYV